jgi:flagellar protein FliS
MTRTDLAYRTSAAQGASGLGLLVALYDTLAGDLRRAAQAELRGEIESRCREANHALLVIAHLEDWLRQGGGGFLAEQLSHFYASLRRKVTEAQIVRSAAMLEEQMNRVLELREFWQRADQQVLPAQPEVIPPHPQVYAVATVGGHAGWSA